MPGQWRFGLLGSLLVSSGGTELPVLAGKQRALLAALLLRANRRVSLDELAEAVWGTAPPASARGTLRDYVKEVRKALGDAGGLRIATVAGGYLIRVDPGELDLGQFESLLAAARAAGGSRRWQDAGARTGEALALWRGEPLADVPSDLLALHETPRLTELHLQAIELRAEADLQLGRHAEAIPDLTRIVGLHPMRERLRCLLMLALYRDGRLADALAAYREARDLLVEELGAEPGPELALLHQQILEGDPALARHQAAEPEGRARARIAGQEVPHQLPAAVSHFTGRAAELAELTKLAAESDVSALVICAVGGTAGVGKTAMAVQWAHQVADDFPDGQLYVNLRGYDPDEPVSPADALASFLRTLGVPGADIPDDADERAGLYRSRLAGRRMLILLDNARDGDQVRPLLPGEPRCVAVVTSRDTLAGLVAADGAIRLDLDVLPPADAVGLLRSLIGGRVDADPQAAETLAGLCAWLPLALRIAAEIAAARRTVPLAQLAAELATSRLDVLDAGEDRADVRAVFSWSARQLPDNATKAFMLAGLHPGADLDVHAFAALAGTTTGQARRVLDRLRRASLLQAAWPGRYGMHDLLRVYARERSAAGDSGDERRQALTRLFDYYLAAAAGAMDVLFPAEADRRPRIAPAAAALPQMPGEADARAWLDQELANLVAVVVHCAGHGWPRHATSLAATLFRYLMYGSHLPEALTVNSQALHAARQSGDLAAEAEALNALGGIGMMNGHFGDAAGQFRAALERYRQCGDRAGEARVLRNLSTTEIQLHNHSAAADYCRQAITACHIAGDSLGAARALTNLAAAETYLGRYDQAAQHLHAALPVLRQADDQVGEARALEGIGEIDIQRGQLTRAAEFFDQALATYRRIDSPAGIAGNLINLADVSLGQGNYQQAISHLREALALSQQAGYQHGQITALRTLAKALHQTGQPAAARTQLAAALRLAAETGSTYQQASAHRDLAESHQQAGDGGQARHHWQQALDLYTQLGAPEADQIRVQLRAQKAMTP
jgi:DNA-binding SARP family transcriptional activator